jgi:hypothetical protein
MRTAISRGGVAALLPLLALVLAALAPLVSSGSARAQAASDELVVMPFRCTMSRGRPAMAPATDTAHRVLGRRRTTSHTACAPGDDSQCRRWTIHRFDMDCDGVAVPWPEVVAATVDRRRAWVEDGAFHMVMPPDWGDRADDPCAAPMRNWRPGLMRYCNERHRRGENFAARTVVMPPGYAPTFGIDAIFVPVQTARHGAGTGAGSEPGAVADGLSAGGGTTVEGGIPVPRRLDPYAVGRRTADVAGGGAAARSPERIPFEVRPSPPPPVLSPPTVSRPPGGEAARVAAATPELPRSEMSKSEAPRSATDAAEAETVTRAPVATGGQAAKSETDTAPRTGAQKVEASRGEASRIEAGGGPERAGAITARSTDVAVGTTAGAVVPRVINAPELPSAPPSALAPGEPASPAAPTAAPADTPPTRTARLEPAPGIGRTLLERTPVADTPAATPAPEAADDGVPSRPLIAVGVAAALGLAGLTLLVVALRRGRTGADGATLERDLGAIRMTADAEQPGRSSVRSFEGGARNIGGGDVPATPQEALQVLGLGLAPNADLVAIKKMVDAMRFNWHPDRAENAPDRKVREQRLQQINAAWDILAAAVERERPAAGPTDPDQATASAALVGSGVGGSGRGGPGRTGPRAAGRGAGADGEDRRR